MVTAEQGLPQAAIDQGYGTVADWQYAEQQQLSDKQYTQQKDIADQQNTYNEQALQYQKDTAAEQAKQTQEQSDRQSTYDTGRAQLLSEGQKNVNDAFAQFTPDYFQNYAKNYMSQAADNIAYQKIPAQKQMAFGLARKGTIDSQSGINQAGVMAEDEGRALAEQSQNATTAANSLKANVADAKTNLLGQVTTAESIGSPIAGSNTASVQNALDTTKSAISGVTNSAGDVTASLNAVPTVNPLSNVFANSLTAAGSYLGGIQANTALNRYTTASGLSGTSPFGKS